MNKLILLALAIFANTTLKAQLKISPLFSKHMVLQQKKPIAIWGHSAPATPVQISFLNKTYTITANNKGEWKTFLDPATAGGPHTLIIKDNKSTLQVDSVMIGEVWLASGQSNMEWSIKESKDPEKNINTHHPMIRLFQVPKSTSTEPVTDLEGGNWKLTSPESLTPFSAVAFHFAHYLANELKIPVGIIHGSWGATNAEAWTSRKTLLENNHFVNELKAIPDNRADWEKYLQESYKKERERAQIRDTATIGVKSGVQYLQYDDSQWSKMDYPVDAGKIYNYAHFGFMWFRNTFELHSTVSAKTLKLSFPRIQGQIVDFYLDGQHVVQQRDLWDSVTITLPAKSIKKGKHVLAIRIYNEWSQHKIGKSKTPGVQLLDEKNLVKMTLPATWLYNDKVEPEVAQWQNWYTQPTVLYNAMIYPLQQYSINGFIWYQGESNAYQEYAYTTVLNRMIQDWRNHFEQGDLPFYIVQLANYMETTDLPNEGGWAKIREAQLQALKLTNTGLAVILDVGEADDIHPKDKQTVGERLAKWALAKQYEKNIVYSGPIYDYCTIEGNAIRIHFKPSAAALQLKKNDRPSFIIAGEDKKFYWTNDVTIDGNTLLVRAAEVPQPRAVRYAWANNPAAILFNTANLPASSFRTDNWKE
jgi:sialate O-acetylesterase